ncbi:uncharacterized protein [Eleutherodactylus coqui]|uniref:MADF domain-containing protein n=2 Tax=Eleutherodactylus coqui TaxID=57060 RepID=A0A8J6FBF5_ELECQ|nr:hypothetical protein GDO78_008365 [Eleutherodactylus coqui]
MPTFDMGKLIALMEDKAVIWDCTACIYRDRYAKEQAWEELAVDMFPAEWLTAPAHRRKDLIVELKTKWRSARDQFRREYSEQLRGGSKGKKKKPYLYLQQLMYLARTVDPQLRDALEPGEETSERLDTVSSPAESQSSETMEGLLETSWQFTAPPSPATAPRGRGRKRKNTSAAATRQAAAAAAQQMMVAAAVTQEELAAETQQVVVVAATQEVQNQFLEPLESKHTEHWSDAFCRYLATNLRSIDTQFAMPIQTYMQTLVEACTPPSVPYSLFAAMDHWRYTRHQQNPQPNHSQEHWPSFHKQGPNYTAQQGQCRLHTPDIGKMDRYSPSQSPSTTMAYGIDHASGNM